MTFPNLARSFLFAMVGAAYGAFLAFCAAMSTAGGDGTYIMFAVFTSPLLTFGIPAAIAGTPVVWAIIGSLLGSLNRRASRFLLVGLMAAQYAGIPLVLRMTIGKKTSDWELLTREPEWGAFYLVVYGAGHVAVWWLLVGNVRKRARFRERRRLARGCTSCFDT